MTKNQIEYANLLEQRRSNLQGEALTAKRDQAAIEARLVELREQGRHNAAQEALTGQDIAIRRGNLDEVTRHNRQSEAISLGQISESRRHNIASEQETALHNRNSEAATIIDLNERARHNLASEEETSRHNVGVEEETKRHNVVGEATDAGRLALDTVTREQQIAETKRHNQAMESKDYSTKVSLNPTTNVSTNGSTAAGPQSSSVQDITQSPPKSENIGRFYYSRVMQDGKRHLMYAYQLPDGDKGWAEVKEDNQGRQYVITKKGKRINVG